MGSTGTQPLGGTDGAVWEAAGAGDGKNRREVKEITLPVANMSRHDIYQMIEGWNEYDREGTSHNIEAEQAVLGAMMLSKDAILSAKEILRDEDFCREDHRIFFRTVLALDNEGVAVDLVTVTEQLRKDVGLEQVGGIPFVTYIANYVPTALALR